MKPSSLAASSEEMVALTGRTGWAAAGLGTITKAGGVLALLMLLPAAFASLPA